MEAEPVHFGLVWTNQIHAEHRRIRVFRRQLLVSLAQER